MTITNEQLGVRVDQVESRLSGVENQVSHIRETMASKEDINAVLRAITRFETKTEISIAAIKSDTAGPVETFNAARAVGKFFKWVGGIFAAAASAYMAWRALR